MGNKDKLPIKRKRRTLNTPLTKEELLRENEYLREEDILLKKPQALAQEENKHRP